MFDGTDSGHVIKQPDWFAALPTNLGLVVPSAHLSDQAVHGSSARSNKVPVFSRTAEQGAKTGSSVEGTRSYPERHHLPYLWRQREPGRAEAIWWVSSGARCLTLP